MRVVQVTFPGFPYVALMTDVEVSTPRRPGSVTAVAVLVFIGALLQFVAAGAAIFLALRPGEVQQLFSQPITDWYWWMTAILSLILGVIYIWIGRGLLTGDPQAWLLVNVLTVINMIFALFQIPFGTGWLALVLGAVILIMNNTMSSRTWFQTA